MGLPRRRNEKKLAEDLVDEELSRDFRKVEVRRYNSVSIRVRISDPKFKGLSFEERERAVHKVLERLPEEIQADITMLILLAPGEKGNQLLNYEFDNPTPDKL